MKFNPNYKTKDGYFEVELDLSKLTNDKPPKQEYWQNAEITIHKIRVYNTHTNRFSEKSIYYNEEKGYYFKGKNSYWHKTPSSKYYINDLLEVKENE